MSMLSNLQPAKGSTHSRKVVGRGRGSGMGGTSTKGNKGQKARSGGRVRWGFEGGQMPLARRVPKYGFKNANFRNRYETVNLKDLAKFTGEVTPELLVKSKMVHQNAQVKILGVGEIKTPLTVHAHKFSGKAKQQIEAAGGKVHVIEVKTAVNEDSSSKKKTKSVQKNKKA